MSQATPALGTLIGAEVRKLFSRTLPKVALAVLVLIALGGPLVAWLLSLMAGTSPEAAEAGIEPWSPQFATVLGGVLYVRNFYVFRLFLIAVVTVSVAGEFAARTLREDLLRPVTRGRVLVAKWSAVQVFVLLGALVPLVCTAPVGAVLFGLEGDLDTVLRRFVLTWLSDAGFATLVVAIALGVRSVPGTLMGVVVYAVLDQSLGWFLWLVEAGRPVLDPLLKGWGMGDAKWLVELAIDARPWLPSAAFNLAWDYIPQQPLQWQSYVSLALITGAAFAVAWATFSRTDVP